MEIKNINHKFTLPNMILYAGSTWDWHKIHYDEQYLRENSIPKPVVDGQVFGALIVKQIQSSLNKFARIEKMKFNYKNMVFQDEEIEIKSKTTKEWEQDNQKYFEVATSIYVEERIIIMNATTVVKLGKIE